MCNCYCDIRWHWLLRESHCNRQHYCLVISLNSTPNRLHSILTLNPLLGFYCQGANQDASGVCKNAALIDLRLQFGEIGIKGGGAFSLTCQPNNGEALVRLTVVTITRLRRCHR